MKLFKSLSLAGLLASLLTSGMAVADRAHHGYGHGGHHGYRHGGASIGFYIGPTPLYDLPYYGRPYYPYPYPYAYAYPPVVISPPAPQAPPVYIEQGQAAPAPEQSASAEDDYYWYHCDKPEGYYPYIKECPAGWQKVAPEPEQ